MTSAAHVKLSQQDIDEAMPEMLIEDEFGYSPSKSFFVVFYFCVYIYYIFFYV